jgi:hypothetical protein
MHYRRWKTKLQFALSLGNRCRMTADCWQPLMQAAEDIVKVWRQGPPLS